MSSLVNLRQTVRKHRTFESSSSSMSRSIQEIRTVIKYTIL